MSIYFPIAPSTLSNPPVPFFFQELPELPYRLSPLPLHTFHWWGNRDADRYGDCSQSLSQSARFSVTKPGYWAAFPSQH